MAGRMLFTIVGWEIYIITKDDLSIGLLGLSEVIPAVLVSLYAGNIVDKKSRKRIVTLVAALNTTLLTLLALSTLWLPREHLSYAFYGYAFGVGVLRSFWGPSLGAMVPNIISRQDIPRSGPYNKGAFLIGSITGHATGGFLIANISLFGSISVGIILFALSLIMASGLPSFPLPQRVKVSTFENIKEGLLYIYTNKVIFSALMLDLFAVLFGGVVALIPIYAKDILMTGPSRLGWLNAAMDIGAAIGILGMGLRPMLRRQGLKMIFAVLGFGICIIVFAVSKSFWLSIAALMAAGIFDAVSMIVRGVILESYVPDQIRGRVMSVNTIFISSSNELGQFESGVASKLLGTVRAAVFGGMMTILISSAVLARSKKLRELEWRKDGLIA